MAESKQSSDGLQSSGGKCTQSPTIMRHLDRGIECCDPDWEAAYQRFESPEEEVAKFRSRLVRLGIEQIDRNSRVVELFCGRGNGLVALEQLGFLNLHGVDLSENLLEIYRGPATLHLADCRQLPFEPKSFDVVIMQGGLHHLPDVESDLPKTLNEIDRILTDQGRILLVEPWNTPFLKLVRSLCGIQLLRKAWPKLDALAIMIEREQTTYDAWLNRPTFIHDLLEMNFHTQTCHIAFGRIEFSGVRKSALGS